MPEYRAKNAPLKGWRGLAAVAGMIGAVLLDSLICTWLKAPIGATAAALLFWLAGLGIALAVLRIFVRGINVRLTSTALLIMASYAKYERELETIYRSTIVAAGTPEEVLKKRDDAGVCNCLLPRCDVAPFAVAFVREGVQYVYIFHADEPLREALTQIARENQSRKKGTGAKA